MHYIRFLKTPKVTAAAGRVLLNASVTLTTDLGETFFDDDLDLAATICSPDNESQIFLRKTLKWSAGMRSLPITFDLTRSEIEWPAKLHVGLRHGSAHAADIFELFSAPHTDQAFVTIWSEPFDATRGRFEASHRVERRFLPLSGRALSIYEDTGDSIARHLWDGSVVLTAYIDRVVALQAPTSVPLLERALVSATFRRLNILELGCGCGIVGISLAQSIPDCNILLTDLPEVKELVDKNISIANLAISSNIKFAPLDWEAPLPPDLTARTIDMIIAAECIYNSDSIPPLVKTMQALIKRNPRAIIVISTKFRHESELEFFELASKAGLVQSTKTSLPIPGRPGHGYGDFSEDVNLHVLHGPSYRMGSSPRDESRFDTSSGSDE